MDRHIGRHTSYIMNTEYKGTTLVELLIVMILTGIVTIAIYSSLDIVSHISSRLTEADASIEHLSDSLSGKDIYIQDSLYYAEQDSLRIIDKTNEMNYDE